MAPGLFMSLKCIIIIIIIINLFARAVVLQSSAPCFLAELLGAKSTSHGDN